MIIKELLRLFHLKKQNKLKGRRPGLPFRPYTESYPSSLTLLSVVGRC